MKLYLVNAENIYFQQIKEYFREIISSYDNGNYRSAMVMLYSTIVCDLLLKLKELSDVYSDEKAEKILSDINEKRRQARNSEWEWSLINKIRSNTELLNDDSYAMLSHIYDLRNFSAHPAVNEDYELISPTPEMTVAYIKKALDDILTKPSVFAENIIDRMSDDVADRREQYSSDFQAFESYLDKVYFQRMSPKMARSVFKAFWKFTFIKSTEDVFKTNRLVNRNTLEAMLNKYHSELCDYVENNQSYFKVAAADSCLTHLCILLSFFPQLYNKLDETVRHQVKDFNRTDIEVTKWFIEGNLEKHLSTLSIAHDRIHTEALRVLKLICKKQGQPHLFIEFLLKHYSESKGFISARDRFDHVIEPWLGIFKREDFLKLFAIINDNDQIYKYACQRTRNDRIMEYAKPLLPDNFDFSQYPNFRFSEKTEEVGSGDSPKDDPSEDDFELPF